MQKDRTVSLNGLAYEVDASLVGETVTLRFDPALAGRAIQVIHGGKQWSAKVVDLYGNCFVKRDRPSQTLAPAQPESPAPPQGEPPRSNLRLTELADAGKEVR